MDEIDRLNLLFGNIKQSKKLVLKNAGVNYDRFAQVMGRKVELRAKELTAIAGQFPEFEYWILTGKELPEKGWISPMTKAAHQELGTQGKA
jgi:hypothetical protein